MRKAVLYFITFILLATCPNLAAQEKSNLSSSLIFMYSPFNGSKNVVTETTSIDKNYVGYAYAELASFKDGGSEAYGQFLWEQKFWEHPIFIHTEYRGFVGNSFYESTAYIGAAYCIYSKYGYLTLEPLAMWKERLGYGGQFSVVGGWEWKHFIIEHYTDLWKTHKMDTALEIYSQTRLFVKVYNRLSAGVVGTIYYGPDKDVSKVASLALRWRL